MQPEAFYAMLVACAGQLPDARFVSMADLHGKVVAEYLETVGSITAAGAAQRVPDGRTVAQVVGHIAAWERNIIVAIGEILAAVKWPRLMSRSGYIDPDGRAHDFPNIAAFNAYYAEQHVNQSWAIIQADALHTAGMLDQLFRESKLITAERLEHTWPYQHYSLPIGVTLTLPCGWFLWMITIEHEAVEHTADLALGRASPANTKR